MLAAYAIQDANHRIREPRGLTVRTSVLFLFWLALVSLTFVLFEPAPFDGLMVGLIFLMPLAGLTSLNRRLILFLIAWLTVGGAGWLASAQAGEMSVSIRHTAISVFLSFAGVLVASVIHNNPSRHTKLILSALIVTTVFAAVGGTLGYFGLVPGGGEILTKFDRAKGAFKDPNVFGAFLVPGIVYCVHRAASARAGKAIVVSAFAALLSIGLLVSFSRGAWFNGVFSIAVYACVAFIAAHTDRFRLKLFVLGTLGLAGAIVGLIAILQVESVANLISQRATLMMGYDTGPEGRFGGQWKALALIAENPLGLGALEFSRSYHTEDVHNVYLSMFLNAGWIGGFVYFALVVTTLGTGLAHSLRKGPYQGGMIVLFASFAGLAAEGVVVDTDHWRHFYVFMGLIWGLAAANDSTPRARAFRSSIWSGMERQF